MAQINLGKVYPLAATNITQEGDVNSVQIRWDESADLEDQYEVWTSTQNSLETATLAKTVIANQYDQYLPDRTPMYAWLFTKNKYGTKSQVLGDAYQDDYLLPEYGRNNALGSFLKWNYVTIFVESSSPTTTVSVRYVQAKMYWTTAAGVDQDSGWMPFDEMVESLWIQTEQGSPWVNSQNALADDASLATFNVAVGKGRSDGLAFSLFGFGIPDDAVFKGIEVSLSGKSTSNGLLKIYAFMGNTYDSDVLGAIPGNAYQFPVFTATNTLQTKDLGSSTNTWYVGIGGFPLFRKSITPDQLTVYSPEIWAEINTYTPIAPSVVNYAEWYDCGAILFSPLDNYEYQFNNSIGITVSNVVSSGSDVLEVLVCARIDYIPSDSSSVNHPEPHRISTVLRTAGTSVYGLLQGIYDFHTIFRTGFRDIGVAGGEYRLVLEVIKVQRIGTPTCDVVINFSNCTVNDGDGGVDNYVRRFKLP